MPKPLKSWLHKLVIAALIFCPTLSSADWVDDWIRQKSVYGGGTYSGQDRGFVYGGNASLRYQPSKDYLVTLTPPNFRNGCGGIDLFMGGFSFLKAQELIEKFKNIMGPAAIAFAFDIALETLCPQCASTMKDLENLANKLNQLQLDDCKAQKAVVAVAKNATGLGGAAQKEAIADFMINSGLKDSYEAVKNFGMTASHDQIKKQAPKKEMTKTCPKEIKNLFFTPGTLLENISDSLDTKVSGYTDLIRSIIGDVKISPDLDYTFIAPCLDNADVSIDSIMTGNLFVKNQDKCMPCKTISIDGRSYRSILEFCEYELENIINSIINKSQLPQSTMRFLNQTQSFCISDFLKKHMLETGNDFNVQNAVSMYSPVLARWYTYHMMKDLLSTFEKIAQMAVQTSLNKKGSEKDSESCQINLKDEAFVMLTNLQKDLAAKMAVLNVEYEQKETAFFNTVNTMSGQQDQFDKARKAELDKIRTRMDR